MKGEFPRYILISLLRRTVILLLAVAILLYGAYKENLLGKKKKG